MYEKAMWFKAILAFSLDFGQLRQSFEILTEFHLTVDYHAVPIKKIKLPTIGPIPKLEKVGSFVLS